MVTIAIPLYNSEKYIEKCLDSVLAQTFVDIEVLLIDDCSTDNSLVIVDSVIKRNTTPIKIRVVHQEKNQGVGMARNRAIEEAKGDFLYFLDSDDMITSDCMELLFSKIVEHKCNLVIGSYSWCHDDEYPIMHDAIHEYAELKSNEDFFRYKYAYTKNSLFTLYIWNILFDLKFLRKTGISFKPYIKGEDHIFFLEIMPFIQSGIIISNVTYKYVLKKQSLSNYGFRQNIPSQEVNYNVKILKEELSIIKQWHDNEFYPEIMFQHLRSAIWMLLSIIRKEKMIKPYVSRDTLRFLCTSPLSLNEIITFKRKKLFHLSYYLFGQLPLPIQKMIIRAFINLQKKHSL